MKEVTYLIIFLVFISSKLIAQEKLNFNNLDSLFVYAEDNSATIKNTHQKTLILKWQKIAAQAGLVNFRMQTNFNMTNNLELPVTYLPGEAFGGEPGTTKEVTTGQQYITNINFMPQIDLINLTNWAKLKSTAIDSKITEVDNLLVKKTLFESIAAAYYNVISLQEQIKVTKNSLIIADSLLVNIQNKYKQGIIRLQDLNDAKVYKINTKEKLIQIQKTLEQQYNNLKILCDIPEQTKVTISEESLVQPKFIPNLSSNNQLRYKQSLLEVDKANAVIKQNRFSQLPILSFTFYDGWQQSNNESFFNDTNWNNSTYVGLKLSIPFPNVNAYTQTKMSRINKTISKQNSKHIKLQNQIENQQMTIDYEKAFSQLQTNKEIKILKQENYNLALNQFNADVLATDKLLIAFNDMLISKLNYRTAYANVFFTQSKIKINNQIK